MAVPTCLELGCGTGFFLLNHKLAGIVDDGFVTYLSAGMVLAADENARRLDFEVRGAGGGRGRPP